MKIKLALFIILGAFILAGCSQTYVCPDGSTATSPEACFTENIPTNEKGESEQQTTNTNITQELEQRIAPKPSEYRFTLDEKELANIITFSNYNYVAAPTPNEYNDKSSVRNIPGTKKYETHIQTDISFAQLDAYKEATLFMKILGADISGEITQIIYEGYLWPETQTINLITILQTPAENPRIKFCFGFTPDFDPFLEESEQVACFTRIFEGPVHKIFLRKNVVEFTFGIDNPQIGEILQTTKEITITNEGTVPTTYFIYTPTLEENYLLTSSTSNIFLNPGEEESITFTGQWNYTGDLIFAGESGGIYTAGHSCLIDSECYSQARVREELLFEYRK
jgi:hypothetical protein